MSGVMSSRKGLDSNTRGSFNELPLLLKKNWCPVTHTGTTNNNKEEEVSIVKNLQDSKSLPHTLLQDIRKRNIPLSSETNIITKYHNSSYKCAKKGNNQENEITYNDNVCHKFYIHENVRTAEDENFANYKDTLRNEIAIRSAKGTVRGVKNRVREGIATFLQINALGKNYKEKEQGKVVVYTTTIGVLRNTYQACMTVKKILRTLLVKFEERDLFMSSEYQAEIQERMQSNYVLVPQVFAGGYHVGDAETIERLNETGELRKILEPYKSAGASSTCTICGGYRILPCQVCSGSKKSVHRNHFTTEFVSLKCMNCDEVGLVRCTSCS